MSQIEEYLKSEFEPKKWDDLIFYLGTEITPPIFRAMKKYAAECVKASLSKASIDLEMTFDQRTTDWIEQQEKIISQENIILL